MALLKYRDPRTETWEPAGKGPTGYPGTPGEPGENGMDGTGMTQTAMDTLYVPTAGGTMTGPLDMGSNRITNLAPGITGNDLITVSQLPNAFTPPAQVQPTEPAPRGTYDTWIDTDATVLTADDTWIRPQLINGWTDFGYEYHPARYRKLPGGTVELQGLVKDGNGVIFYLDPEYAPTEWRIFATHARGSGSSARIDVGPDGAVQVNDFLNGGGNGAVSLNRIRYTLG